MIDIHSHFLYGLDDGARDIDMSLAMLRQAEQLGILRILATPHTNEHTTAQIESLIIDRFDEISDLIGENNLDLEIKLAAEISYNSNLLNWLDRSWALAGDRHRYMIFELPLQGIPLDISHTIFQLLLKKVVPVFAHPERNYNLQLEPEKLITWVNQGALVQMNAGSIVGKFGKKCQRFSERMLEARAVHIVASDAHDSDNRNYFVFKHAFQRVHDYIHSDYAQLLFVDNPRCIFEGHEVSIPDMREDKLYKGLGNKIFRRIEGWGQK